jgi:hypothetical protein
MFNPGNKASKQFITKVVTSARIIIQMGILQNVKRLTRCPHKWKNPFSENALVGSSV